MITFLRKAAAFAIAVTGACVAAMLLLPMALVDVIIFVLKVFADALFAVVLLLLTLAENLAGLKEKDRVSEKLRKEFGCKIRFGS